MKETKVFLFLLLAIILIILFVPSNIDKVTGLFTGEFTINIDPGIKVICTEFDGSTTEFIFFSDTELENIANTVLERSDYGKVIFNENVNLTQDVVGNIIDIDAGANISYNRIEIDTTALTSLEKPATLYLYNLTFDDPRILRDGAVCPSSICTKISYVGGTLIFNVTDFTTYSAEETPVSLAPTISVPSEGGKTFYAEPTIASQIEKEQIRALFDIRVSMLPSSREIVVGTDKISFNVELIKFKLLEELTEVKMNYKIYSEKDMLLEESEELEVQKGMSFIKTLSLPELEPGSYEVLVSIEYEDGTAESKASFTVREQEYITKRNVYLLGGTLIVILATIGVVLLMRYGKKIKKKNIFVYLMILLFLVFILAVPSKNPLEKITGYASGVESISSRPLEPLLDVTLLLFPRSGEVEAGETLIVETKLVNIGIKEAKDVLIEYTIWDFYRTERISKVSETVAVQTSITVVKHIHIPKDLPSGNYVIDVRTLYENKQASSSSTFIVKSAEEQGFIKVLLFSNLSLLCIIAAMLLYGLTKLARR